MSSVNNFVSLSLLHVKTVNNLLCIHCQTHSEAVESRGAEKEDMKWEGFVWSNRRDWILEHNIQVLVRFVFYFISSFIQKAFALIKMTFRAVCVLVHVFWALVPAHAVIPSLARDVLGFITL